VGTLGWDASLKWIRAGPVRIAIHTPPARIIIDQKKAEGLIGSSPGEEKDDEMDVAGESYTMMEGPVLAGQAVAEVPLPPAFLL